MQPDQIWLTLLLAGLAGFAIPAGGLLGRVFPGTGRAARTVFVQEVRHGIAAFGGGALLSAVALVLVPEGIQSLPPWLSLLCVGSGGLVFMGADRALRTKSGGMATLMAMLLDFVPEAMALGATLLSDHGQAVLLALLIAMQNLPEGFNAYQEIRESYGVKPAMLLAAFAALALLGPISALLGQAFLTGNPGLLGAIMLFSSGGILYLMFQDIAPQAVMERHWLPPLGAVLGFMLGLAGYLFLV